MFVLEVEDIDLMTRFYYNGFTSVTVRTGSTNNYSNWRGVQPKALLVHLSVCVTCLQT